MKITAFVAAGLWVLTGLAVLIQLCFRKKDPMAKQGRDLSFIMVIFVIPVLVLLIVATVKTKAAEKRVKSMSSDFDMTFANSTFYYLGMDDFRDYLRLLIEKLEFVPETATQKLYVERDVQNHKFFASSSDLIANDAFPLRLRQKHKNEAESLLEIHNYLKSISSDIINMIDSKTNEYKDKLYAIIENTHYIYGSYSEIMVRVGRKVQMAMGALVGLIIFVLLLTAAFVYFWVKKTFFADPEKPPSFSPEKAFGFPFLFVAVLTIFAGFGVTLAGLSVEKGYMKMQPSPLSVAPPLNVKAKEQVQLNALLEQFSTQNFFKNSDEIFKDFVRNIKKDPSKVKERKAVTRLMNMSKNVSQLINKQAQLLLSFQKNLGDADLLVRQINMKVGISNFNFPVIKHIDFFGSALGRDLKGVGNTLAWVSLAMFVVVFADLIRVFFFN